MWLSKCLGPLTASSLARLLLLRVSVLKQSQRWAIIVAKRRARVAQLTPSPRAQMLRGTARLEDWNEAQVPPSKPCRQRHCEPVFISSSVAAVGMLVSLSRQPFPSARAGG